jgi:hypothetical protein
MVLSWGWFEKEKGVVIFPRFWADSLVLKEICG